jgi:hypothetical protein
LYPLGAPVDFGEANETKGIEVMGAVTLKKTHSDQFN